MTAEELLMMSDDIETYSVDDSLVIDPESRVILTPVGGLVLGVESDEESERVHFVCPRFVGDNIDLSTLQLRVIYRNAKGEKDYRICTDVRVDGDNIRFSWLLSRKVTRYKGKVNFIVCAIRTQADGTIKNEWNTTLAEGIALEGLEIDVPEEELEEPKDIVLQLIEMLNQKEAELLEEVENIRTDVKEDIEVTKQNAMDEVEAKGKETLETIPEDYIFVSNLAKENKQLKANAIKVTSTGETIVATDSAEAKFEGLRVFGRSEQASTTGKNLLNNKNTTETINGVTFTVNKDKSVTVNGTATGSNAEFSFVYDANIDGDCILSGCPNGGSLSSYYINVLDTTTWESPAKDFGSGATLSLIEGRRYHVRILIVKDKTVSNLTFYPMIRIASITDGTYEPYTGGKPSPNPEFPQLIESVGDDGSVDVGVYGKNLFDYESLTVGQMNDDGTIEESQSMYVSSYIKVSPLTTYHITSCGSHRGKFFDSDKKPITNVFDFSPASSSTFTTPSAVQYVRVCCYPDMYKNIQLERGTVGTTYEPYKGQSLSITTPNGLPAIKVTDRSLATYTDAEGNMWCADEIDFARGKYVQRIKTVTLDGKTDGHRMTGSDISYSNDYGKNFAYINLKDRLKIASGCMSTVGLSERYGRFEGIYTSSENYSVSLTLSDDKTGITASDDTSGRVSKINAWLKNNPVTVRYVLAEPIETDLTSEQLESYKALHSNYPTTTILNDDNAYMEVTLVVDTKNHIEQNYVPKSEFLSVLDRLSAVEQALA